MMSTRMLCGTRSSSRVLGKAGKKRPPASWAAGEVKAKVLICQSFYQVAHFLNHWVFPLRFALKNTQNPKFGGERREIALTCPDTVTYRLTDTLE